MGLLVVMVVKVMFLLVVIIMVEGGCVVKYGGGVRLVKLFNWSVMLLFVEFWN